MAIINPFPGASWFSIDEDQYLMYLLKGYKIVHDANYYGGTIDFMLDDLIHREDGPAIIWHDGGVEYAKHGKLHKEDGPAVIWSNGDCAYYLNGKYYSKEEAYYKALKDGTY